MSDKRTARDDQAKPDKAGNDKAIELGMTLAGLILEHGITATLDIIGTVYGDKPSEDDIAALKLMAPPPESYLPDEVA